jgi:hypothetical protein
VIYLPNWGDVMAHYHLSDILQAHYGHYQQHHRLSQQQRLVCQHILACRTAALGQQQWQCDNCHYQQSVFCSCRDRHCPRCQGKQTQAWIEKQQAQVLACRYFHWVFTLPHELNVLTHTDVQAKLLYSALFEAVWQTLSRFGMRRKHLQGQLGCTAVLHTWGQTLTQHIHLHCLIPGGVITAQGQWRGVKSDYLFPVKAVSTVFKAKMLAALRLRDITIPKSNELMDKAWCVYSKACLYKAETVVSYLGRYTRKGMLHESRLKQVTANNIDISYTDYRDNQRKIMQLAPEEFIRRYLLHVLPKGVMRIRHFGFLANSCRRKKLSQLRAQGATKIPKAPEATAPLGHWCCPQCETGQLQFMGLISLLKIVEREAALRLSG